ncbi:hypothetical protein [Nitrosococcus watsonii]|uniref:Uncharacterized protein n=1 Tax=Nitrosococcus watsoni (strain C-113) TaxID=105559 RepID=D8KBE4_NITWC|nr:hypothetical protein [Nitrosococcus watsonii]ADJ29591.1 hypothetical protein Nwat_2839 [Nitrosococcus watsonii C-113]
MNYQLLPQVTDIPLLKGGNVSILSVSKHKIRLMNNGCFALSYYQLHENHLLHLGGTKLAP